MKNRKLALYVLFYLFTLSADATIPKDFLYQGLPIEALCFFNMETQSKIIDLRHCGLKKEKYLKKDDNKTLIEKGYTGFDWQNSDLAQGYSYYKVFPVAKSLYWLFTLNNGGGNGAFTALYQVKRINEETLELNNLAAGDRCNGGIQDVSEKNNQLIYSVNLTAYDLIALSNKSNPAIKAYEDLANCAVCCVAKGFYKVYAHAKPQLQYIDLNQVKNAKELPQQGSRQSCFNSLFTSYIALNKTHLEPNQLNELVGKFKHTCYRSLS